jgi:hypothetical protein
MKKFHLVSNICIGFSSDILHTYLNLVERRPAGD